jgi:hypothetical protein
MSSSRTLNLLINKLTKFCGCEVLQNEDSFQNMKKLDDSFVYDPNSKQWQRLVNGTPQEIKKKSTITAPPPSLESVSVDFEKSNSLHINTGVEQRNRYIDIFSNETSQVQLFIPKEDIVQIKQE